MLSMTNKFYNQMKLRLQRDALSHDDDIEQGPSHVTSANAERASKPIDKRDPGALRQVVVDQQLRELPRPPSPRPQGQAQETHPPRPYQFFVPEEV